MGDGDDATELTYTGKDTGHVYAQIVVPDDGSAPYYAPGSQQATTPVAGGSEGAPTVLATDVVTPNGFKVLDTQSSSGFLRSPTADLAPVAADGAANPYPSQNSFDYGTNSEIFLVAQAIAVGRGGSFDFKEAAHL